MAEDSGCKKKTPPLDAAKAGRNKKRITRLKRPGRNVVLLAAMGTAAALFGGGVALNVNANNVDAFGDLFGGWRGATVGAALAAIALILVLDDITREARPAIGMWVAALTAWLSLLVSGLAVGSTAEGNEACLAAGIVVAAALITGVVTMSIGRHRT